VRVNLRSLDFIQHFTTSPVIQVLLYSKASRGYINISPWQVSILRTQLNSKNAEVETERLTKAQEMESQAQEYRDKMKDLQKELEHMRTQLEFKVRDVFLSYKVTVNIKQLCFQIFDRHMQGSAGWDFYLCSTNNCNSMLKYGMPAQQRRKFKIPVSRHWNFKQLPLIQHARINFCNHLFCKPPID